MFDNLRFKLSLWRPQREKRKLKRFFRPRIADARTAKNRDREHELINEYIAESNLIYGDISHLVTSRLRDEANKYLIPAPEFDSHGPDWIKSASGRWHLSADAAAKLRSDIRKEKRELREPIIQLVTLLIGLLGAMIGVFSALKK